MLSIETYMSKWEINFTTFSNSSSKLLDTLTQLSLSVVLQVFTHKIAAFRSVSQIDVTAILARRITRNVPFNRLLIHI